MDTCKSESSETLSFFVCSSLDSIFKWVIIPSSSFANSEMALLPSCTSLTLNCIPAIFTSFTEPPVKPVIETESEAIEESSLSLKLASQLNKKEQHNAESKTKIDFMRGGFCTN